jgi:hypothetical protein
MKPDSPVADTSVRLSDDPPERSAVFAREGLEHRTRKVDSTFGSDAPSLEERIVLSGNLNSLFTSVALRVADADLRFRNVR